MLVTRPVAIEGQIKDYKKIYKTGKFSCFEGITRIPREIVFDIDSDGRFVIDLDLPHPVLGCAHLDLEGEYYSLFLQPGANYRVSIEKGQFAFVGESGRANSEVAQYSASLAIELAAEQAEVQSIHSGDLSLAEARSGYEKYAEQRREHLYAFADQGPLSAVVRQAIEQDIRFEVAHSLICFRYESANGRLKPRASLPTDFLGEIYRSYPVNTSGALVSRRYIDYIANIVQVLEDPPDPSVDARMAFYGSQGVFSEKELKLVAGAYRGDREVLASEEFRSFDSSESQQKDFVLGKRYKLKSLLEQVNRFPAGLGRDLIVSQGLARYSLASDFLAPTASEWNQVEDLVQSEFILRTLRHEVANRLGSKPRSDEGPEAKVADTPVNEVSDFLAANRGKVIYIDFWATWCAPCRAEIPDAKRLAREFENDDVVFLNLCAQSKKADWSRLVEQKELDGEHMLLSEVEYQQLAETYDIVGFPTYVLIDREGTVVSKNASRPSSGKVIVSRIRSLLQ